MTDVFISYSRKDKEFVSKLYSILVGLGKDVWVDWEDIPPTADWWKEIQHGIEAANTFVFVLSPDSVASLVCGDEVRHAVEHSKRLVPIVYRDGFPMEGVHPAICSHNWIFFRASDPFDQSLAILTKAIETDFEYVALHTRLLVRASEWKQQGKDLSCLLRGGDLNKAEQWLAQAETKDPKPAPLQMEFIHTSRKVVRRQRATITAILVGLVITATSTLLALIQYQRAEYHRANAELRERVARVDSLMEGKPINALIVALEAVGMSLSENSLEESSQVGIDEVRSSLLSAIQGNQEHSRLLGHEGHIYAIALNPTGDRLVSADENGVLRFWNLQTGEPLGEPIQFHDSILFSVAWSPDGKTVVIGDGHGKIHRWTADGERDGEPIRAHPEDSWVNALAFSPDGQLLASAGYDGTIRLWDAQGNAVGQPFQGHLDAVLAIAFSPDGQTIASASFDKTIRLWNLQGNPIQKPFYGHDESVVTLAFSQDGQQLVSGGGDRTVRLWNLQGNSVDLPFVGHEDEVTSVAFSADGDTIVSASLDKTIRLWDLQGNAVGQPIRGHEGGIFSMALSSDGKTLISTSADHTIRMWQVQNSLTSQKVPAHEVQINSVAFSPDGQTIATASDDGTIKLWDIQGNPVGQLTHPEQARVSAIAFSPDGQTLVSSGEDGLIYQWNVQQQQSIGQPLQGHEETDETQTDKADEKDIVQTLAFHPKGDLIISGGADGTVRLWNIQQNQPGGAPFEGHTGNVRSVTFSPDGESIASSGDDGKIRLWNLEGDSLGVIEGQDFGFGIAAVAFDPQGKRLVIAGDNGTLRQWDVATQEPLGHPFQGHTGFVSSIAFSSDGRTIASAGEDGTLRLWDVNGNAIGQPFEGHDGAAKTVAFSPDGETVVSADEAGNLHLWRDATLERWLAIACNQFQQFEQYSFFAGLTTTTPREQEAIAGAKATCQRHVWHTDSAN
jgi:WD40 repeat protein